jgi:hypothetical protein
MTVNGSVEWQRRTRLAVPWRNEPMRYQPHDLRATTSARAWVVPLVSLGADGRLMSCLNTDSRYHRSAS